MEKRVGHFGYNNKSTEEKNEGVRITGFSLVSFSITQTQAFSTRAHNGHLSAHTNKYIHTHTFAHIDGQGISNFRGRSLWNERTNKSWIRNIKWVADNRSLLETNPYKCVYIQYIASSSPNFKPNKRILSRFCNSGKLTFTERTLSVRQRRRWRPARTLCS